MNDEIKEMLEKTPEWVLTDNGYKCLYCHQMMTGTHSINSDTSDVTVSEGHASDCVLKAALKHVGR